MSAAWVKWAWLALGLMNAAVMFMAIGRGTFGLHHLSLTVMSFYIASKEWETEDLRTTIRILDRNRQSRWSA